MLSDKYTLNLKISIPSQYFKAPESLISNSSTCFFSSHSSLTLSQDYIIYINNKDILYLTLTITKTFYNHVFTLSKCSNHALGDCLRLYKDFFFSMQALSLLISFSNLGGILIKTFLSKFPSKKTF